MGHYIVHSLSHATSNKTVFTIVFVVLTFLFGFLAGSYWNTTNRGLGMFSSSNLKFSTVSTRKAYSYTPVINDAFNSTHLWSMRLADENYFRLAKLLPCRTVEYSGGPKVDKIDSCDHSTTNEFSIQTTLEAQLWLYKHQYPINCTNKRFAIIEHYAPSGFGSTIHQVVWAFGMALADDRIAVYQVPGHWMYGECNSSTPDCFFLPISNCSLSNAINGGQTIRIGANSGHWPKPILPPVFQNRTFNWYRAQLLFYIMRFKPELLANITNSIAQQFIPPTIEFHRPYIAIYVRRSDKVQNREMSQAYTLKQYFDLFDADARRANISTVYINSEDQSVFNEFTEINKEKQGYYKLLRINVERNVIYRTLVHMSGSHRGTIVLQFLTDLFIEVNAELHAGTLSSNWCRLVDEMRLVLGKTIPFYTPENRYLMDMRRKK